MVFNNDDVRAGDSGSTTFLSLFTVSGKVISTRAVTDRCARVFREANAMGLRLAAMDALLLTKWWRNRTLIQYIFAVIAHDPSREVRRHVSRALITSLPVLQALGELRPAGKDEPLLLIEDDGTTPAKDKAKKGESELLVKTLKREIGRSKQLRDSIMPIML